MKQFLIRNVATVAVWLVMWMLADRISQGPAVATSGWWREMFIMTFSFFAGVWAAE